MLSWTKCLLFMSFFICTFLFCHSHFISFVLAFISLSYFVAKANCLTIVYGCNWNFYLCEVWQNLKMCVKYIPLLFIDLQPPLALDAHTRIRINQVQEMDHKAPSGVLDGRVLRHFCCYCLAEIISVSILWLCDSTSMLLPPTLKLQCFIQCCFN